MLLAVRHRRTRPADQGHGPRPLRRSGRDRFYANGRVMGSGPPTRGLSRPANDPVGCSTRPPAAPFVRWLVLTCCVGALTARAEAGEPPQRTLDMSHAFDAGTAAPDIEITPTPPDPAPMVERGQWVFDLRWDRGDIWLLGVRRIELPAPQSTPRAMGRFAVELFEGPTLIERVRFDFPLLALPDATDAGVGQTPTSLTQKLRTRIGVVFPATARGTDLVLVDRATGRRWSLAWPTVADTTQSRGPTVLPSSPPNRARSSREGGT
jgi:hypothetical protein